MKNIIQNYEIKIVFTDNVKSSLTVTAKSIYDAYEKALEHANLLKKRINEYCIIKKKNNFFPP